MKKILLPWALSMQNNVPFYIGQTTSDGRLSHFARVENCTFSRNSAQEFGAAMAASTLLFLEYTGGITPLEIIDW